jgi:hypothetical protein
MKSIKPSPHNVIHHLQDLLESCEPFSFIGRGVHHYRCICVSEGFFGLPCSRFSIPPVHAFGHKFTLLCLLLNIILCCYLLVAMIEIIVT